MTIEDFHPTHVVPQDGLAAWEEPDVSRPTAPLDPLLPVRVVDRRGDWGRVLCANGWSAWVDGRLLISVPQEPPVAGKPLARTADPRPLLARAEEALGQYRRAAEELASGRTDGETFRRRTQGLRVGMVVDGEAVWLYDAEHERWVYCDGTRLSTFAIAARPAAAPVADPGDPDRAVDAAAPASPEPTRVVDPAAATPDAPEATRVVDPAAPAPDAPEATRVVDPKVPAPDAPEATRVVDPAAPAPDAPEATRVVDPAPVVPPGPQVPEATRVVPPHDNHPHPPTRPGDG